MLIDLKYILSWHLVPTLAYFNIFNNPYDVWFNLDAVTPNPFVEWGFEPAQFGTQNYIFEHVTASEIFWRLQVSPRFLVYTVLLLAS